MTNNSRSLLASIFIGVIVYISLIAYIIQGETLNVFGRVGIVLGLLFAVFVSFGIWDVNFKKDE